MSYFANSHQLPEWARHIPRDWGKDWLKWSVTLSTRRPDEDQRATLPYLSNEDIASWTGKLLRDELEPLDADSRLFEPGDVLFNKLRPYLAKVFHANFAGTSSGELLCLRPSSRVDARYLFYVLTSFGFIDAVDSHSFGSKMPRADWETVGHQPLPLPRIDVQQRIARFLDEKTMRIDSMIEKKQALLERLAEKRQAMVTLAVTQGLDPSVQMRPSDIGWVGDIPCRWNVMPLKWIATIGNGSTPARDDADYWSEGRYPWLNSSVVNRAFVTEASDFVTELALRECHLPRIEPPAVLVGITGQGRTRGMATLLGIEATINQHIAYIKPEAGVADASYMRHLLSIAYEHLRAESDGGGSTKGAITCEQLGNLQVPVPDHGEQVRIAAFIDQSVTALDRNVELVAHSIKLQRSYRSSLITAAVTGQIPELNG